MLSVSTALERLRDCLSDDFPPSSGTRIFDIPFPLHDAFDPLLWCGHQAQWPQFYWLQRNGDEELAALGAVKTFPSLAGAHDFLQRQGLADLRICGLNAFNPQEGRLFLPRLEWRRVGGKATLRLLLNSETSLREDAIAARAFLQALTPDQAQPAALPPVLSEQHSPDYPQWHALIEQATQAIAAGEMDKVVLARATDVQFAAPPDPLAIVAASRRSNHRCFHFMMAFNAQRTFFGSTPERLWRRRGTLLRICAAASGLNSLSLTIPAACISCSRPPRSPDYRAGRRWHLLPAMNLLPGNGTPAPLATCRWRKANSAWPCVRRKSKTPRSGCMPEPGLSAAPILSRSGRR